MGKSRAFVAALATGMTLACLLPAQAQFWDWGNRPQRQQQQYNNNWFGGGGGWFGNDRRTIGQRQEREVVDYLRAPAPAQKKPEDNATSMWSWATPTRIGWRTGSKMRCPKSPRSASCASTAPILGLIRYDARRDVEWPQMAREIIAAEKPKSHSVMMIGNNDRQTIREKAPTVVAVARPGAPKAAAPPAQPGAPAAAAPSRARWIPRSSRPSSPRLRNCRPT